MFKTLRTLCQHIPGALGVFLLFGLVNCTGLKFPGKTNESSDLMTADTKDRAQLNVDDVVEASPSSVDLSFLLSMNYTEAKAISTQSLELPMGVRVAADRIEVLKMDKENKPKRIRAKGKVYIESGEGIDASKALCQEALITFDEIILRGKPILQRGGSVIEGLDDETVAYMLGTRLRVIGLHRRTNHDTMLAMVPDLGPWAAGPNLLLPALAEDSVPTNIREEMLKATEAEAVLQYNRSESLTQPDSPPAPWVKGAEGASKKMPAQRTAPPVQKNQDNSTASKPGMRTAA